VGGGGGTDASAIVDTVGFANVETVVAVGEIYPTGAIPMHPHTAYTVIAHKQNIL
jgi:hypothetical protein